MITNTYNNIRRIFFIADTHFGVRANNNEWLQIQEDYFNKFFIPLLKANVKEGDICVHLGDVFDNRQSINIKVLNSCLDIISKIAMILPVHIIAGNHDCYSKQSNTVNSLKPLTWIPNVRIFEEPELLTYGTNKILLMPWRVDPEHEVETLKKYPEAEYLFCHTDFKGMKFNKWSDVEHGNPVETFNAFKRVYSGHIHYAQQKENINLVGCPYQLTRSDRANSKGIWMLDLETDEQHFIINKTSPEFIKLDFEWMLNKNIEEINLLVENNFVDITINSKWILNYPINTFLDYLKGYRKIGFDIVNSEEEKDLNEKLDLSRESFNILKFAKQYVETLTYEDQLKEKLYQNIVTLYNKVISLNKTND